MTRRLVLLLILCIAATALLGIAAASASASIQFNVSFSSSVHATPLDGHLLVIVSPTNNPEPRLQAENALLETSLVYSPPLWGMDVDRMQPGVPVLFGGSGVDGSSLASLDDLAPGKYYVQALLNVYTTFHRADGSVVKLHLPAGDGNDLFISPGNLVSTPVRLLLDPAADQTFTLQLDQVLPPLEMVPPGGTTQQGNPIDTKHYRHIKIKSALLSKYWGRPIYIGADVLLPEGYDDPANRDVRYPVIWHEGHFGERVVYFDEKLRDEASRWWVDDSTPRFLLVNIRHETPFYDDSYAVNSANLGPYGDAIAKELIPAVDDSFRTISARWARTTLGGSTGGWEAAAQMIFYPRLYSGAWVAYPDPLDFRGLELVNIYDDPSAYFSDYPESLLAIPSCRDPSTGETLYTVVQENRWELALGTHGRSGLGQWDIWQAAFGPQGCDGYPAQIWDKRTGLIDHAVARAWRPKDLSLYLQRHWDDVGPLVAGRMIFVCGTMDDLFLDHPTRLFEERTATFTQPRADFSFEWGEGQGHGWLPKAPSEFLTDMAAYMADQAPPGTDVSGWMTP